MMTTQDKTVEILGHHLDSDFRAYPMASKPNTEEQVIAVGERIGILMPPEVVAHLSGVFPGVFVKATEEAWPRIQARDTAPFWAFLYALHTFTASQESDEWMRIEYIAERLRSSSGSKLLPVLQVVGSTDIYCLDIASELVRFHEKTQTVEPINMGFFELFEHEVCQLKERMEKIKRGEL